MSFTKIAVLLVLPLIFPHMVLADGDAGQAGEFLRYGVGARALGMGRAFTAVADDASAIYWNPAGLGQLDSWEVTTMYNNLFLDTWYGYFGGIYPYKNHGTFGLGIVNLHTDDFEGKDELNKYTHTFSNNELGAYVSFGGKISWQLFFGTSLKIINQNLDGQSETEAGLDLALMLKPFLERKLNLAFVVQNMGAKLWYDQFPVSTKLGASYTISDFTVAGEGQYLSNRGVEPAFGVEYNYQRKILGRGGFNGTELSIGFGLPLPMRTLRGFQLDFAYAYHMSQDLGGSVRISFTYAGPGLRPEERFRPVIYESTPCVYTVIQGYTAKDKDSNLELIEEYGKSSDYKNELKWVAKAYVALAECAYLDGDWDKAIAQYNAAEHLLRKNKSKGARRKDAFAYENNLHLMESYMHHCNWSKAKEVYENKAEGGNKSKFEMLYDVGICYQELSDFASAQATFEEITRMSDRRYRRLGLAYLKLGKLLSDDKNSGKDLNKAIEYLKVVVHEYQTGLECYPSFPKFRDNNIADDAQYLLGECYLNQSQPDLLKALNVFAGVKRFFPGKNRVQDAEGKVEELLKSFNLRSSKLFEREKQR
jgi:tetratricopeptide (TPR) repeat protein